MFETAPQFLKLINFAFTNSNGIIVGLRGVVFGEKVVSISQCSSFQFIPAFCQLALVFGFPRYL